MIYNDETHKTIPDEKQVREIQDNNELNIMETVIVMSPVLKERFDRIKKRCMDGGKFKKPDNVTWGEVAFSYMLVITERFDKGDEIK